MYLMEDLLLDLRLKEELPYVDEFHIVEAEQTFSGNTKLLHLKKRKLPKKVKYHTIKYHDPIIFNFTPWQRERRQRDYLYHFMQDRPYKDTDVFFVCDMDETLRGNNIVDLAKLALQKGIISFKMINHYYYLNYVTDVDIHKHVDKAFMVSGEFLRASRQTFEDLRLRLFITDRHEVGTGHHFSYLNTPENISCKIKSFAHQEYNIKNILKINNIAQKIDKGEDILNRETGKLWYSEELNDTYPQHILDNKNGKYKDWIKDESKDSKK